MNRKRYVLVMVLVFVTILMFAASSEAGEMTLKKPDEDAKRIYEVGRFHIREHKAVGLFLVDTKTGNVWRYQKEKWIAITFIKGQPFPGELAHGVIDTKQK